MKVTANACVLARAAALAERVIDHKATRKFAALGVAQLRAGDRLTVTVNNLEATLTAMVPAEIAAPGMVAVPVTPLAKLVAALPVDARVGIELNNTTALIVSGRRRFKLPALPQNGSTRDLEIDEEIGRATVSRADALALFATAVKSDGGAVSPYMRGVFLHNTADGLSAVMTDGRSLVRYTVPSGDATLSIDYTLVVPTAAVELISRQLMDMATTTVMLRRSRRLFAVETESTTFVTRLIDTTYPAYEKIIPAPSPQAATVKRNALHAALSRALAVGHGRDLKLSWADDELHLVANDTIDDMIDAVVTGEGAIAIQAQFLDGLLGEMRGTRVSLSVTSPNQPLRIADPDNGAFVALLAPRFT